MGVFRNTLHAALFVDPGGPSERSPPTRFLHLRAAPLDARRLLYPRSRGCVEASGGRRPSRVSGAESKGWLAHPAACHRTDRGPLVVASLLTGALGTAAANALPGDNPYGVKLGIEQARRTLALNPQGDLNLTATTIALASGRHNTS